MKDDVMLLNGCTATLPMSYDGTVKITHRDDYMLATPRGRYFYIDEVNASDYSSFSKLLTALTRYAGFTKYDGIRYYESLPDETIEFLKDYGFEDIEFPSSSLIHTLEYRL